MLLLIGIVSFFELETNPEKHRANGNDDYHSLFELCRFLDKFKKKQPKVITMTENLEERLRLCSTRFNHPDKAYPLLKLAAEQGKFQYIETQVPTLLPKKNKKTGEKAKLGVLSIELLRDYVLHGIPFDQIVGSPLLGSNYPSQTYGDGNKVRGDVLHYLTHSVKK